MTESNRHIQAVPEQNAAQRAVAAIELGSGSEHFRYGRETMQDDAIRAIGALPEDHPTLLRVGGYAIGFVTAQETRDDGTFVYEVEPLPQWRGLLPAKEQP